MANKDSMSYTFFVAFALCIVCSVVVSTAAVNLKPMQEINKAMDFKRNILQAAGMYDASVSVDEQFKNVQTKIVDLSTGKYSNDVDPDKYDQRKAAKDSSMSTPLDPAVDSVKTGRVEHYAEVYVAKTESGEDVVILPVRGYGLWSTLYGFLALQSDLNTIVGLGFYEHGETPGLGGEVDNPLWKNKWKGKTLYDVDGKLAISVGKLIPAGSNPSSNNRVDGLSGATLTTNGVHNIMQFWLGEQGYGKFLQHLKDGEA